MYIFKGSFLLTCSCITIQLKAVSIFFNVTDIIKTEITIYRNIGNSPFRKIAPYGAIRRIFKMAFYRLF